MVRAINRKNITPNLKNQAPFATMEKTKLRAIASKAGKANKGKKKGMHYTRCINCEVKDSCSRAFQEAILIRAKGAECERTGLNPFSMNIEKAKNYAMKDARCLYEIEHNEGLRNKELRSLSAFTSKDPTELLKKVHLIFRKLEGLTESSPSFAKYAQMFYMLTNMYKILHPESKASQTVNISSNTKKNATVDIKVMMQEMREKETPKSVVRAEDVIDAEVVSNEEDNC